MSEQDILASACREAGVQRWDVCGPGRRRELVIVRREVARRCRDAGYSFPAIGRVLGGRHHTTIMQLLDVGMSRLVRRPRWRWLERT